MSDLVKDVCESCGCGVKRIEEASASVLALTCISCEEKQTFHRNAGKDAIKTTFLDLTSNRKTPEVFGGEFEMRED